MRLSGRERKKGRRKKKGEREKEEMSRLEGDIQKCPRLFSGSLDARSVGHNTRLQWLMKLESLKYFQLSIWTALGMRKGWRLQVESVMGAILEMSGDGWQQNPVNLI